MYTAMTQHYSWIWIILIRYKNEDPKHMHCKLIFWLDPIYLKNAYANKLNYMFELLYNVKDKFSTTSYL